MIELDGSHGEGGGSILRLALALSIITGKDFSITNIRRGRPRPGLSPQHLSCVNAAKDLCGGYVEGHFIGSTNLYFRPGALKGSRFRIDVGTAGSITLLLQALIPPAVFSGRKMSFDILGGTDVKWSMPFDYLREVFLPQMRRFADIDVSLLKRGYYPKGAGEVKISIDSKVRLLPESVLEPILLVNRKNLLQIRGISHASLSLEGEQYAERMNENAALCLKRLGVPANIKNEYSNSISPGGGIVLWALFGDDEIDYKHPVIIGGDALADPTLKPEALGTQAANNLMAQIEGDAVVDEYLADQLIPFLAIAGGVIKTSKVTPHVLSNIHVAEKFLDCKFTVSDNVISCERIVPENTTASEV